MNTKDITPEMIDRQVEEAKKHILPGFILNPDERTVRAICKGVLRCDGECPCANTCRDKHCPCSGYREDGHCCCHLYLQEK